MDHWSGEQIQNKLKYCRKILKFLHTLFHNMLPPYFESYKPFLEKILHHILRPHPLPLPPISHVYAESGIIYQLVHMKNIISVRNKLIMQKMIEISHSFTGFSKYNVRKIRI